MDIPSFIVTGMIGLAGVGAGYGALKIMAARNTSDIRELKTSVDSMSRKFVPQTECALRHDQIANKLETVTSTLLEQRRTTRRLVNYAIHQLTSNGMSLAEAQDVLENGKD